ncbi:MAG TPA: hypothetical protein VHZ51_22190 [Ktedonobacteraceae bacterium]|jgi:hypothetical protein|nr:hypothetical protein [Ktedonobacteraceae bacterium]
MTYSRRNIAEEQKEAYQKAKQLTAICEQLHITLDPIDWQNSGMRARVTVNTIEISDLLDLSQLDSDSILRRVQIKLFEHAALETMCARPGGKALVWSPVEVVQPQAFLSLWIITLETDERIAIAEYLRNGQRVYEHYELDMDDGHYLAKLFGSVHTGEYQLGDTVTIEEHEHKYIGEIVYILPPSKAFTHRKFPSRSRHTISGKAYTNDASSRYIVDCKDGFPHVVNQWQVISETSEI